jgi:hypothetical protein
MLRIGSLVSMFVLALVAGALVASGRAAGHPSGTRLLVGPDDRFELASSHVACRVFPKRVGYTNRLVCYREVKPRSHRLVPGSYGVLLGESGVKVFLAGSKRPVFARSELPPAGAPADSAAARALFGGYARLTARSDRVYVAGTNIVCRPYGSRAAVLLCVTLGSAGHVDDGTYMAWISDRGVLIAQARGGQPITVFRRHNR